MQENDTPFVRKMTEAATIAENAGKMAHNLFVK
jgi:hypothetical protein